MSKFGDIIKEAKNQNTEIPESKKTRKPENSGSAKKVVKTEQKDVNLSIKVSESKRRHWVSEAKKQGTSLTAVIIESLNKRFGEP
jgi:ABC-type transporter MlaC component